MAAEYKPNKKEEARDAKAKKSKSKKKNPPPTPGGRKTGLQRPMASTGAPAPPMGMGMPAAPVFQPPAGPLPGY